MHRSTLQQLFLPICGTAVIVLAGCGGSESGDRDAGPHGKFKTDTCNEAKAKLNSYTVKSQELDASSHDSAAALTKGLKTVIANGSCFAPEEVTNAETALADAANMKADGGYVEPAEPSPNAGESEPQGVGPTEMKTAGDMRFRIENYYDKYPDDTDRVFDLTFCPSGASATWTPMKPGNIVLTSTSGESLDIVSFSQFDSVVQGFPDAVAEQGSPLTLTRGCDTPQKWGVYFSDEARSTTPQLSTVEIISDEGATVTFDSSEVPAFEQVQP